MLDHAVEARDTEINRASRCLQFVHSLVRETDMGRNRQCFECCFWEKHRARWEHRGWHLIQGKHGCHKYFDLWLLVLFVWIWTHWTETLSCFHWRRDFILVLTGCGLASYCYLSGDWFLASKNGVYTQWNQRTLTLSPLQVSHGSKGVRDSRSHHHHHRKQADRKTILRKVNGAGSDLFVVHVKGKKIFLRKLW